MIEKNIICCYYSTEVEPCGHPSIHIPKLLMVKYFPNFINYHFVLLKHHSLTLLSHLASMFIKVEVFLTIEALCIQIYINYKS